MKPANPSRRAFVLGAAALAVGAGIGAAARPCAASCDALRPPGAADEAEFMARCIRCDRCISVCPTDVLYPLGIEAGVFAVRTPALDFRAGSCTFCDLCRQVCPTEAIGSVDPHAPEKGRIGGAQVLPAAMPGVCDARLMRHLRGCLPVWRAFVRRRAASRRGRFEMQRMRGVRAHLPGERQHVVFRRR